VDVPRTDLAYAIFGRRVDPASRLAKDDRVEITRPLVCDPKLARSHRAARKG
jgi:putative ubiquitin-RnfH superfamily antitoxin RatB of RatAB toxin-antitoxin module